MVDIESDDEKLSDERPSDDDSTMEYSFPSINQEKYDSKIKKAVDYNFKLKSKEDVSESITKNLYFHSIESNKNKNTKSKSSLLGIKKKRNDDERQDSKPKNKKNKIFEINHYWGKKYKYIYRFDYYIKKFKGNFLNYVRKKLNRLVKNIKFGTKFGKIRFDRPNRGKYAGNSNEKSNRTFSSLSVKQVFTDGVEKNLNYINRIENKRKELSPKKIKNEKEKLQIEAIRKLMKYLKYTIKEAMDEYYDTENDKKHFGGFRSQELIKFYDNNFYKEKNRNYSLLVKNNFIKLFPDSDKGKHIIKI